MRTVLLLVVALAFPVTAVAQDSRPKKPTSPLAGSGMIDLKTFHFPIGKDWVSQRPSNSMRAAQAQLPAPKKGDPPAELVVFYFGQGQGGDVEANIARWKTQFEKPEGLSEEEFAKQTERKVDGLSVTVLEMRGKYVGSQFPGRPAPKPIADARLHGLIVETAKGNYFVKITGARSTLDHHQKAIDAMVAGIRKGPNPPKGPPKGP